MANIHLTLIGKPGCHLCDDARDLVATVVQKVIDERPSPDITVEERSILDDAELHA
ncbi:thioredoxin, partial [Cryobacterium sp. MLB-32]